MLEPASFPHCVLNVNELDEGLLTLSLDTTRQAVEVPCLMAG